MIFKLIQTLNSEEKLTIVENLSIMSSSGIPIVEALEAIKQDLQKNSSEGILGSISKKIQEGSSLAEALEKFPNIFDKVFISTVKAGEASGNLDKALRELSISLKREIELESSVKSALLYPILVITVANLVLLVILFFVIPRIAEVFINLRIPLPIATKLLLIFSLYLTKYKLVFFILLFIFIFLIFSTFKNKKTKGLVLNLFNNLPIIKPLILKIDLIRFTRTFSTLLGSGVPIIEACDLSAQVISQNNLKKVALSLKNDLAAGKNLSDALKSHKGFFPGVLAGMVATGEKSGNLDKTLIDFSDHLQDKVSLQVKNIATLIEPILLIIIGIAVGAIIIAIIAPIYQLIGQISPQ